MTGTESRSGLRSLLAVGLLIAVAVVSRGSTEAEQSDRHSSDSGQGLSGVRSILRWVRRRAWPLTMFIGLVGFGSLTLEQWPDIPSTEQSVAPTGGLGLYIEDADSAVDMTASGTIELRSTGFPDVDVLWMRLRFANPVPGTRWFFLASGLYASSPDLESNVFCSVGGDATRVSANRIDCPNRASPELPGISYMWGETLGSVLDGEVYAITDGLIDFDPGRGGMMVSGVVSAEERDVFVWMPVQRMVGARSGSSVTFSYPGIGGGRAAAGGTEREPARKVASGYETTSSQLAVISTGIPVRRLGFETLSFEIPTRRAPGRIEWSNPPTDEAERLRWSSDSSFLSPASFTLYDVTAENETTRRTFRSGILATISVGLALLLLEHLFHREAKP